MHSRYEKRLPIYLSQHDIHAAEDDDDIGYGLAEAHIFQDGQIDKARWTDAVAIRVRCSIANEVEAQLAFRRFDSPVRFTDFWAEPAQLRFRIHDRAGRQSRDGLLQDFQRFAHFEDADHVAVINVAVVTQRDTEFEPVVNAVFVHFAEIVINPGGAKHRAGNASVNCKFARQDTDALRA